MKIGPGGKVKACWGLGRSVSLGFEAAGAPENSKKIAMQMSIFTVSQSVYCFCYKGQLLYHYK